jgi:hypothetical protein
MTLTMRDGAHIRNAAVGKLLSPRLENQIGRIDLDEVDLGREIRSNFEADFLLANCGLRPGLHDVLHQDVRNAVFLVKNIMIRLDNVQSRLRED